jgi:hypothetical protein
MCFSVSATAFSPEDSAIGGARSDDANYSSSTVSVLINNTPR